MIMRGFTPFEKEIMKYIIENDKSYGVLPIQMLYELSNVELIEWDDSYNFIKIYASEKNVPFRKIIDIISLLSFLEENNYIFVSESDRITDYKIFNRKNTKIELREDGYYDVWFQFGSKLCLLDCVIEKHYSRIGKDIEKWANSVIFITQAFRDLVSNDFKTAEKMQFEESMKWTKISVWTAIIIGLASIVISIIGIDNPPLCCIRYWMYNLFN